MATGDVTEIEAAEGFLSRAVKVGGFREFGTVAESMEGLRMDVSALLIARSTLGKASVRWGLQVGGLHGSSGFDSVMAGHKVRVHSWLRWEVELQQ